MQHNLLKIIKSLPLPGGKWGSLAIPFTTFGTISSGEALYEAAELLKKTGRKCVLGMKVEAYHCFTKKWKKKINENMPGEEALLYIEELATEIMKLKSKDLDKVNDISDLFNYQSKLAKFKANVFLREKQMHKYIFPKVKFNYSKCKGCERCKKVCAVQCIEMKNGFPVQVRASECIHCAECFHNCPHNAISLNIKRYEPMLMIGAQGKGFLASNEQPKTKVFLNDRI
jgi:Fe-S-cluster-containing hydrogenase component 2